MSGVDHHLERLAQLGLQLPIRVAVDQRAQFVVQRPRGGQRGGRGMQTRCVCRRRTCGGAFDERGADLQVNGDVLAGLDALVQVVHPRPPPIHPAADGVLVAADPFAGEAGLPQVVAQRLHLGFVPGAVTRIRAAPAQDDAHLVMAVTEHVGLDGQPIPFDALDREASAVDARPDVLDDDAPPAVFAVP